MLQANLKLDTKSLDEIEKILLRKLNDVHTRVRDEVLPKISAGILAQSLKEVPKDTTTLSQSQYALDAEVDDSKGIVTQRIGYGGPADMVNPKSGFMASSYAADQHENFGYMHKSGEKPKYLEDPVNASIPEFKKQLAKAISKELEK